MRISLAFEKADPTSVSAGFLGFVVFFALAIALWLLIRNMTGRLRRMNYAKGAELEPNEPDQELATPQAPSSTSAVEGDQTPSDPEGGQITPPNA